MSLKRARFRPVKLTASEAARLGAWKIWANEQPTEPGAYWIGCFFRDKESLREGHDPQREPEEVELTELSEDELKHYALEGMVYHLLNYEARNLIWYGPLQPNKPPGFKKC